MSEDKAIHQSRLSKTYLYVGNLSLAVTETEIRLAFGSCGQVVSVSMMNDEYIGSRQPRGYAYVEMSLKSQCEAAVQAFDGKLLGGRLVSVVEALPVSHASAEHHNHEKYRRR
jgi:RNA recognition motif-containing protein